MFMQHKCNGALGGWPLTFKNNVPTESETILTTKMQWCSLLENEHIVLGHFCLEWSCLEAHYRQGQHMFHQLFNIFQPGQTRSV